MPSIKRAMPPIKTGLGLGSFTELANASTDSLPSIDFSSTDSLPSLPAARSTDNLLAVVLPRSIATVPSPVAKATLETLPSAFGPRLRRKLDRLPIQLSAVVLNMAALARLTAAFNENTLESLQVVQLVLLCASFCVLVLLAMRAVACSRTIWHELQSDHAASHHTALAGMQLAAAQLAMHPMTSGTLLGRVVGLALLHIGAVTQWALTAFFLRTVWRQKLWPTPHGARPPQPASPLAALRRC